MSVINSEDTGRIVPGTGAGPALPATGERPSLPCGAVRPVVEPLEIRQPGIIISCLVAGITVDPHPLVAAIRRLDQRLQRELACELGPVEIEIFSQRAAWRDHHTQIMPDLPSWVAGDSGRIIRIVLAGEREVAPSALEIMVVHECVHQALARRAGDGRLPAWLDEGLSVYYSQALPATYRQALTAAAAADACLPLEALDGSFARLDRELKTLAYAMSFSLVEHIIARHGHALLQELLAAAARGETPAGVLRPRGLNYYLLEREWLHQLRLHKPLVFTKNEQYKKVNKEVADDQK